MPYTMAVLPEHQLGVLRLSGSVTGDAIVRAIRTLCEHEKWTSGYNTLWDARSMRNLAVSPIEATDILDQIRHLEDRIGGGRCAMVVRAETDYALAQMLALKADAGLRERKVFYSIGEAFSWVQAVDTRSDESLFQKAGELVSELSGT